jgi:hypothetical protein
MNTLRSADETWVDQEKMEKSRGMRTEQAWMACTLLLLLLLMMMMMITTT